MLEQAVVWTPSSQYTSFARYGMPVSAWSNAPFASIFFAASRARSKFLWTTARNENTNGLIRQYLPKSSAFDTVSDTQIQAIEEALNNRPRKSLGWFTPSQVMANFYTVALAA
jgi:IS30 family transposase